MKSWLINIYIYIYTPLNMCVLFIMYSNAATFWQPHSERFFAGASKYATLFA